MPAEAEYKDAMQKINDNVLKAQELLREAVQLADKYFIPFTLNFRDGQDNYRPNNREAAVVMDADPDEIGWEHVGTMSEKWDTSNC